MDVESLKHYNLKRLAKKFNCEEPAKLGRALGVSTQHASKLLLGKAGIGPKTIKRFCDAFGIDANEFVIDPQAQANTEKDKEGQEVADEWRLKLLLEGLSDRMKRLETECTAIWNVLNPLQRTSEEYAVHNEKEVAEIKNTLLKMKGRMLDAAKSGRIEDLGGEIATG